MTVCWRLGFKYCSVLLNVLKHTITDMTTITNALVYTFGLRVIRSVCSHGQWCWMRPLTYILELVSLRYMYFALRVIQIQRLLPTSLIETLDYFFFGITYKHVSLFPYGSEVVYVCINDFTTVSPVLAVGNIPRCTAGQLIHEEETTNCALAAFITCPTYILKTNTLALGANVSKPVLA